jgi:hypothetical protein
MVEGGERGAEQAAGGQMHLDMIRKSTDLRRVRGSAAQCRLRACICVRARERRIRSRELRIHKCSDASTAPAFCWRHAVVAREARLALLVHHHHEFDHGGGGGELKLRGPTAKRPVHLLVW